MNAWNRNLPGLVCPLKLQDGELYFWTLGDGSSEVWQEKTGVGRTPDGEPSSGTRLATNLAPLKICRPCLQLDFWEGERVSTTANPVRRPTAASNS